MGLFLTTFPTVFAINRIVEGSKPLYSNGVISSRINYLNHPRMNHEYQVDHWVIISVLTPCIVGLYLILLMIAYHTFCKSRDSAASHELTPGQIEVISGGLPQLQQHQESPPPAYALTIESGESLYVPPSYKMIFPFYQSCSQDSYGGLPDFSCFSGGI